jgi:hypothetical protein
MFSGNPPMSVEITLHYSWDYAQQVHFPHHAQQAGPIYFKTTRKCNALKYLVIIFSVMYSHPFK